MIAWNEIRMIAREPEKRPVPGKTLGQRSGLPAGQLAGSVKSH